MKLDLQIACDEENIPSKKQFSNWAKAVLTDNNEAEFTIRIVGTDEIRKLNKQYRNQDKTTNVLSFPVELHQDIKLPLLGDIVICAPVVNNEAKKQGKSHDIYWAHITIHGLLHLLGYDHIKPNEAEEMEAIETKILERFDYSILTISNSLLVTIAALVAGLMVPLALAPFDFTIFAFIAPIILLTIWMISSPKKAFCYGFIFGVSCFGFGASWIFISIHTYGNASITLASLITTLLIIILALFPAIQGYLLNKLFRDNILTKTIIAFPISWVLFDILRSWIFTGFPWLFLGYSQINSPLGAYAALFSVYGVTFAVVLTSALILLMFISISSGLESHRKKSVVVSSIIVLSILWLGALFLQSISWTHATTKPIKVTLIQGNIPQELKWQTYAISGILNIYKIATENSWQSRLIVWPEAAIPIYNTEAKPFVEQMAKEAKKHRATIISGIPIADQLNNKYYNGMIAFGVNKSRYLKRHLVPFGEYQPLASITKPFMDTFDIPMSNFNSGTNKQPQFIAANLIIAPFICYEIAYPTEVLPSLPRAQLLVTISDDSWFGKSIASAQHLQIAQMRSLETGRYQLVSTNTGITAIINAKGKIIAQAPQFKRYILNGKIQPMSGATPWVKMAKAI